MLKPIQVDLYMLADLEYRLQCAVRINEGDHECAKYMIENRERLVPKMVEAAQERGEEVDTVVAKFMRGVHHRHSEGLPLVSKGQ